jgi:hypothetical protein
MERHKADAPEQAARHSSRNLVERFFKKIEQCRRIATRYDKLAVNYLAFIKLASIRLWLRAYESTPWSKGARSGADNDAREVDSL